MDDKAALLKSIENFPEEDMPRLMMADYLDENSTSDLDSATAEFIKISCKLQKKNRQYSDEGKWLQNNWQRLVPGLHAEGFEIHKRLGRFLHLKKKYENPPKRVRNHYIWAVLEFWKGYVRTANCYRINDIKLIFPYLYKDQPFALLSADGLVQWGSYYLPGQNEANVAYTVVKRNCEDFFSGIVGHDLVNIQMPYVYEEINVTGEVLTKTFTGQNGQKRAKIAVSNAIRQHYLLKEILIGK